MKTDPPWVVRLVLLPGMDGTGTLFEPFMTRLPKHVRVTIVSYPEQTHLNYEQLANRVRENLPAQGPYIIVAESYSGPVALSFAARPVGDLRAIVLVSSFASRPFGIFGVLAARLPWNVVTRLRPPDWALRWLLLDHFTSPEILSGVRDALSRVAPSVFAARIRDALTADRVTSEPYAVRLACLTAENDRLLRRSAVEALRPALSEGDLISISAPHLLLQCAPEAAVAALTSMGLLTDGDAVADGNEED